MPTFVRSFLGVVRSYFYSSYPLPWWLVLLLLGWTMCANQSEKLGATRLLKVTDLVSRLNIGRSTIYAKIKPTSKYFDNTFPLPVRVGVSSVRWHESAIEEWVRSRH